MLTMPKLISTIFALIFAFAVNAVAEVKHPVAFEGLTAIHLAPGHAPRTMHGITELSSGESRHQEKLPMQLDSAMKKVKKTKYSPRGLSRDVPTDF